MWLAKDKDGVFIFENKPERYDINSSFEILSGFYFEIPEQLVFEILGKNLYISDDPIEIEIRKI
jgi:hypothetical protein